MSFHWPFKRLRDALLVAVDILLGRHFAAVVDLRGEVGDVHRDVLVERHAELFGFAVE